MNDIELLKDLVRSLGQSLCFAVNRGEPHADLLHQYRIAVTLFFRASQDPWEALLFVQKEGYSYVN